MFEFSTSARVIFGVGKISVLPSLISEYGTRVLIVTGKNTQKAQKLAEDLGQKFTCSLFSVPGEPTTEMAEAGTKKALEVNAEVIVGFGGGSPIDCGKAIAMLATNGGSAIDYLEVIGKGKKITKPSLPYIAIPTTAGTGAEVTKNAVLKSEEHHVKVSLRGLSMIPTVALVDPELTISVPPLVTASTGLDAFTQVLEPYVSNMATPITDAIAREGIILAARSLERVYEKAKNGESDIDSRRDMALVSLYGGMALANAKLGAVHGYAGVLGGMYEAPHGMVCAALLPYVMHSNVKALTERDPKNPALSKYHEIGRLLTGKPDATAEDGVTWVQNVCKKLEVLPISAYAKKEDIQEIVDKSFASSSMKGNPIELTKEELTNILNEAAKW